VPSSTDEAEVAELLAELPTHRPPPLYRRWAEVPLPARVHVHGLPGGGDDAIFRGAPAFSATLWRCTGYVPKMCNLLKLKDSRPDLDSVELQTNCDGIPGYKQRKMSTNPDEPKSRARTNFLLNNELEVRKFWDENKVF